MEQIGRSKKENETTSKKINKKENKYQTYPRIRKKFISRRRNSIREEEKAKNTNNNIESFPPQNNYSNSQQIKIIKPKIEPCSIIEIGEGRRNYLQFIWQINLTNNKIYDISFEIRDIKGRDNVIYYVAYIYVFLKQLNYSCVIYAFQNGENLTKNQFQNQIIDIGNKLINEKTNLYSLYQQLNQRNNIINQNKINENKEMKNNLEEKNENINIENITKKIKNSDDIFFKRIYESNPNIYIVKYENDNSEKTDSEKENESSEEELNEDDEKFDIITSINNPLYSSKVKSYKNISRGKIILSLLNIPIKSLLENNYITIIIEQKMIKKATPTDKYNGIINKGMTCYLNSMMQSYNALSLFKKAIFSIPFERYNSSLSSSLQRFFYDLSFGKKTVSSNRLINSFGWSKDDIFIQHDVQEFNMMLSDMMEKKFKGTKAEETFNYLFEGKTINEIKCVNFNFTSVKEEKFNDIQLNVKECKNIYESLNEFTKEEILDGDDKYEVEGHGKEKAIKKMKFIKLPPVLIFQLKRFEFNSQLNYIDKLNDYYEFYDNLNMNKYIEDKKEDYNYILISVVCHKGNVFGGHYFAFINQDPEHKENNWYNFNDENVSKAKLFEVFNNNFGGEYGIPKFKEKINCIKVIKYNSDLSAYILLYIQKSKMKEILVPVKINEVPQKLIYEIKLQKKGKKLRRFIKKYKVKEKKEKNGNYFIRDVHKNEKCKKHYKEDYDKIDFNYNDDSNIYSLSESSGDESYEQKKNNKKIFRSNTIS